MLFPNGKKSFSASEKFKIPLFILILLFIDIVFLLRYVKMSSIASPVAFLPQIHYYFINFVFNHI